MRLFEKPSMEVRSQSKHAISSSIYLGRYLNALSQPATANEVEVIKRNRSLAYLKTKQVDAALPDT